VTRCTGSTLHTAAHQHNPQHSNSLASEATRIYVMLPPQKYQPLNSRVIRAVTASCCNVGGTGDRVCRLGSLAHEVTNTTPTTAMQSQMKEKYKHQCHFSATRPQVQVFQPPGDQQYPRHSSAGAQSLQRLTPSEPACIQSLTKSLPCLGNGLHFAATTVELASKSSSKVRQQTWIPALPKPQQCRLGWTHGHISTSQCYKSPGSQDNVMVSHSPTVRVALVTKRLCTRGMGGALEHQHYPHHNSRASTAA
jgi:hypothetical protein